MLTSLHRIAEKKIEQAVKEGLGKDLPHWKNKPLPPDPFLDLPADRRMAYRLLKHGGYVPEELEIRKEINKIEDLLRNCSDTKERIAQVKRIDFLRFRLERDFGKKLTLRPESPYYDTVVERLSKK